MSNKYIRHASIATIILLLLSHNAFAGLLYYTDRNQFESRLSSFVVDDFTPIAQGQTSYNSSVFRYIGPMSGCTILNSCGNNSIFEIPDNDWIRAYNDHGTFDLYSSNVYAFGFDFDSSFHTPINFLQINSHSFTSPSAGFFGVISDNAIPLGAQFNVSWNTSGTPGGFDNITKSNLQVVPLPPPFIAEPSTITLIGLGILGFIPVIKASYRKK